MNKHIFRIGAFLVLISLLALSSTSVIADSKAVLTQCTETPTGFLDFGSWTFPDNQIHIRGMVQLLREECPGSDYRSNGNNAVGLNANWDTDMTGPMWGTWTLETDEGGSWEGTFAGVKTLDSSRYIAIADGLGIYAGMKMIVEKYYDQLTVTILMH